MVTRSVTAIAAGVGDKKTDDEQDEDSVEQHRNEV